MQFAWQKEKINNKYNMFFEAVHELWNFCAASFVKVYLYHFFKIYVIIIFKKFNSLVSQFPKFIKWKKEQNYEQYKF